MQEEEECLRADWDNDCREDIVMKVSLHRGRSSCYFDAEGRLVSERQRGQDLGEEIESEPEPDATGE
jgi:hypothetical protein